MSTLVFLEHHEGAIQKGALGVLAKALALGGDVAGVVVGHGVGDIAASAGAFGASTVYVVDAPEFAAPLPQPRVDALEAVVAASGAENILFAASVLSADVAAGLVGATRRRAQLGSDRPSHRGRLARRQAPGARRHGRRRRRLDEHAADRARALGLLRAGRDGRERRRSRRSR